MILKFNFRRALYFCLTPSGPACLGCPSTSGRPQIKNWHKTKCSYNNILGGVHLIQNTPYHCPLMKPSRRFIWKDILFTIAWNWLTLTHTTLLLTTTNIKLCGSGRMKVLTTDWRSGRPSIRFQRFIQSSAVFQRQPQTRRPGTNVIKLFCL